MERISRKPPPDCPLCGWSRKDHPLQTHEWTHKSGECAGDDREPCLLRQLTTANEKITEWEAAAVKWFASPEAKQQLDGYRELGARAAAAENALAAANERARKLQDRLDMFSESNEAAAAEITRLAQDTQEQVATLTKDLVAANERAGRMEKALRDLILVLDQCPTRQRGGAGGQTVSNCLAGTYYTGVPVMAVEKAREAMEVRDGLR
jgi:hypothetical protein